MGILNLATNAIQKVVKRPIFERISEIMVDIFRQGLAGRIDREG